MKRSELLQTPEYWTQKIQIEIFRCAIKFMEENKMNKTQFAEHLNVSKGYVTQILNGDCNFSLSKLVELSIKLNLVPEIDFVPINNKIMEDSRVTHKESHPYNPFGFTVIKNNDKPFAA